MTIRITPTSLPEILVIEPPVFADCRGYFQETYQAETYAAHGLQADFVQDNTSRSCRHTLRGLHYQYPRAQGKLIACVRGHILDVAVDIRRGSPRFGAWTSQVLSDENHRQLWVPAGFAHGFLVLSDIADVCYKCTDFYVPGDDRGVLWSDPQIGIDWPADAPLLSEKDAGLPKLGDLPKGELPWFAA